MYFELLIITSPLISGGDGYESTPFCTQLLETINIIKTLNDLFAADLLEKTFLIVRLVQCYPLVVKFSNLLLVGSYFVCRRACWGSCGRVCMCY